MNARDPNLFIEHDPIPADARQQIGRHNVLQIIKPGDLPVSAGLFRVVWANRKTDNAFLLRFPDRQEESDVSTGRKRSKPKLHFPTQVSLAALEQLAGMRWIVKTRAYLPKRLRKEMDELTDFEKKTKVRRKFLLHSFMSDDDLLRIFEYGQMGSHVARTVAEFNASLKDDDRKLTRHHVYQVAYRFWLYGCVENALIADSGNCGAPGKYRNPGTCKRGRPRLCVATGHSPTAIGANTGPDERALIWLTWDTYGGKLGEYAAAHRKMIENYYSDGWHENAQGLWVPTQQSLDQCPSLETFRYYVKKKYTPVELLQQLIPNITWQQTKRAIKGKSFDSLFGPAQTFLIDSTVADVYLVSSYNPYWIIGRPIVYLVRDAWSGMIVGVHVALEGPSWDTARLAIFNAFSPKGKFLRSFGFDMSDEHWPCAHGCLDLRHDRGESLSIPSADSAHDLRINLSACPSFRPDQKGAIETMFHWLNRETVHWLPGAVLSRQRERGERDNRLDATLTMYQFTRIIINAILTFNRNADMRDRLVGPIAGLEIDATPINLWRWGLKNLNGSAPQWDDETLYTALLPTATSSIRKDGVHFAGRCYTGAITDRERWQEYARIGKTRQVKFKYHPNDPHELHVLNNATGNYESLHMRNGDQIPAHARFEEIIDCREYRGLVHEGSADARQIDRIGHDRFREAEIKAALQAKADAIPPATNAEQLSGLTEKRAFEAYVEKIKEAVMHKVHNLAPTPFETLETDLGAPSDLLSRLLAETEEELSHA